MSEPWLRIANAMPRSDPPSARPIDGLDVLVAAAWGAFAGVVVVHVCKAVYRSVTPRR